MFTDTASGTFVRAAAVTAVAAAALFGLTGSGLPAQADTAVAPKSGSVTITGAGWGHGKGMSQYGAYGAASKGLDYKQIIGFYYPGTTLDDLADGNVIRVWISGDKDNALHFRPVKGQLVTDSAGTSLKLPYSAKYTKWRISRSGSDRVLFYRNEAGKYVKYATSLDPQRVWEVSNPGTGTVRLAMPDASTRTYRGKLAARFSGTGLKTVNQLSMESYLRSVVPSEMPAGWSLEALKAQAVAARTYAAKLRAVVSSGASYDLCDTSACQVYKGTASEHSSTDTAVSGTANKVVEYKGTLALTMFSSSNGGWSASAGSAYPYLKAQKDPYDGVKRNQSWVVTLSSTRVQNAYPQIGTFRSVQVTARDGDGTYGGRVEELRLTGSKGSITVSGSGFKSAFGLKERLFTVVGSTSSPTATTTPTPTPSATPTSTATPTPTATATGTAKPTATPTATATATATGPASPPTLPALSGAVLKAYQSLSKADATTLGARKTGVVTAPSGTYADFKVGRITCAIGKDCMVSFG